MVGGKGLLQCHIYDHISAGMSAIYNVKNLGILAAPADAPVRTYYIAAEPHMWDYAPLGFDGCTGQPWSEDQLTFVETTNGTLGSQYKKGIFREYTDASFKTVKPTPPEFGILGPMIKAEVGDKIVVHFKNKLLVNSSVQLFGGLAPMGVTTQYQVGALGVCVWGGGGGRRAGMCSGVVDMGVGGRAGICSGVVDVGAWGVGGGGG